MSNKRSLPDDIDKHSPKTKKQKTFNEHFWDCLSKEILVLVLSFIYSPSPVVIATTQQQDKTLTQLIKDSYFYFSDDPYRQIFTLVKRIVYRFPSSKWPVTRLFLPVPISARTVVIDTTQVKGTNNLGFKVGLCMLLPKIFRNIDSLEWESGFHTDYTCVFYNSEKWLPFYVQHLVHYRVCYSEGYRQFNIRRFLSLFTGITSLGVHHGVISTIRDPEMLKNIRRLEVFEWDLKNTGTSWVLPKLRLKEPCKQQ